MLAQQVINGFVTGSTYALFALGFTLMFGVMGVINLTYGFYFSLGAFIALYAAKYLAASLLLALPLAALGAGLVAIVLDALLLTRLRRVKAPELTSLMVTIGATLLLYAMMNAIFGTEIRRLPAEILPTDALEWGGMRLTLAQGLVVATAGCVVIGLLILLERTRFGLGVRALAENPVAAQLMGVDSGRILRRISFISGALGGLAGVLIGLSYNAIQPYMGETMMLKGFAVIIIGGLGNIRGALIAGLMVGLAEALTAGYLASSIKDAVGFGLLVLTLWLRPTGLFGKVAVKRA